MAMKREDKQKIQDLKNQLLSCEVSIAKTKYKAKGLEVKIDISNKTGEHFIQKEADEILCKVQEFFPKAILAYTRGGSFSKEFSGKVLLPGCLGIQFYLIPEYKN